MRRFPSLFWLILIASAAFVGGRACFFLINPGEESQPTLQIASTQNANGRADSTFVSPYEATAIPQSNTLANVSLPVETSNDSLLKTANEGLNGLSQKPFTLLLAMNDVKNPSNAQFARGVYALVRVDVAHNILDCVALPADLQVSLASGRKDRLDNVLPLGTGLTADNVKRLKQALESNLRIGIDYYLIVSDEGFARAIDQMGTVAIKLPATTTLSSKTGSAPFTTTTPTRSTPLTFNGAQFVRYLTYRENISDSGRLWKIRAIAEALIWMSQRSDAFGQVVALYVELAPDYQTNLEPARMLGLGLFLKSLASEQIGVRAIDSTMVTNVKGSLVQNDNKILQLFSGWR